MNKSNLEPKPLHKVRLYLNPGAVARDLSRRGFTGSLCLTPYTEESRVAFIYWVKGPPGICEILCTDICHALFGTDKPGFYGLRIISVETESGTEVNKEQFGKTYKVDDEGRRSVAMTIMPYRDEEAIQRGVTSSLYLLPHTAEIGRLAVLICYQAETLIYQILHIDTCRALFSVSDIGSYDVFVTRESHDSGFPLEQLDHELK